MNLPMAHFIETVQQYGIDTREALLAQGFHPKVITAKAEKAARLGLTEYGVVADRPWLTTEGKRRLLAARAA